HKKKRPKTGKRKKQATTSQDLGFWPIRQSGSPARLASALSGLLPAGLAAAAAMRSRLARRISRSDPLAGVPESAWPLLQRAEEADASFGWQQIAAGLDGWRRALEGGQVWEEASWPMASLRQMWTETLRDLDLPRLTRRYPELIDPLLFRLLEISVQLSEAMGDAAEDAKAQGGGQDKSRDDAQGDGDTADQQSNGQQGKHPDAQQINQEQSEDPNTQPAGETLAQELMDEFRQDWEPAVDALNEAEEAFGLGCARSLAEHFAGDGGRWRRSQGWRAARKLRKLLAKLPDLRKLVLRIGRRAAVKGRRRWLPREEEDMSTAWGVARSRQAQTETSGLARSGSLELMLPAEAHLLVHGRRRPALRALHHARRLEQSLVSYDRNSWQQLPTRELNSEEVRPAGENGPLILCLDTSGSMARKGRKPGGAPETVAKALVQLGLERLDRNAALSAKTNFCEELKQMELDLTGDGLEGQLSDPKVRPRVSKGHAGQFALPQAKQWQAAVAKSEASCELLQALLAEKRPSATEALNFAWLRVTEFLDLAVSRSSKTDSPSTFSDQPG
ncbi:unnamed protein product, partial [Effrenium voratum]